MNKISKIISILLIAIVLITVSQSCVFADVDPDAVMGGITVQGPADTSGLAGMAGKVLGLIQAATVILAVILIAVFGFKFVLGSAQEKADYQKSFIPLIVGVVVVFAAASIAKLIFSIAKA